VRLLPLGNPLRDESAALRVVLLVLVGLLLVVAASWLSTWLGLAVLAAELVVLVRALVRARRSRPPAPPSGRAHVDDTPPRPREE
jgi:hypothetical protein